MVSLRKDENSYQTWLNTQEILEKRNHYALFRCVLCFFFDQNNQLLLIHKKTGIGAGLINGPGGKVEPGENFKQALQRECQEEVNLTPIKFEERATLHYYFTAKNHWYWDKVYFCTHWSGTLQPSREADPFWCPIAKIPFHKMWESDILWFPQLLNQAYVNAEFVITPEDKILSYALDCHTK